MLHANTHRCLTLLLSAGALLWQVSALAHSELPDAEWCSTGVPTPVAQFEIFPATLRAEREREQQCSAGKSLAKTCGQFDDDYGTSRRSATRLCDAHASAHPGPGDIGSVIAVVVSPASYLHADHHALYSVDEGVQGMCVRCERPRRLPAQPVRD